MGELLLRQSWLAGGWWTSLSISKQQLLKGSPLKKVAGAPGLLPLGGAAAPPVGIPNFVLLIQPRTADSRCVHRQDIAPSIRESNSLAVVEV